MALPPALSTTSITSEDWSNDPDFDFPSLPTSSSSAGPFHLTPSTSRELTASPEDDDFDMDGFGEVDDALTMKPGIGQGQVHKGVITRLTRKPSKPVIKHEEEDDEDGFDFSDNDNEAGPSQPAASASTSTAPGAKNFANVKLSKFQAARLNTRPSDWDRPDTGAGDADEDEDWGAEFEEKEETLRAGGGGMGTVKGLGGGLGGTIKGGVSKQLDDVADEDNYVDDLDLGGSATLPLTLSHLKLVNRQNQMIYDPHPAGSLRHRSSRSSLLSTTTNPTSSSDWDSPAHLHRASSHPRHSRQQPASPSTTATSLTTSHSLPLTDHSSAPENPHLRVVDETGSDDMMDDFEDGLEIPVVGKLSFFSSGRVGELNRLLDKKRKPGPAPPPAAFQDEHQSQPGRAVSQAASSDAGGDGGEKRSPGAFKASRPTFSSQAKANSFHGKDKREHEREAEEPFENGLEIHDDAMGLLNKGRLNTVRKARTAGTGTPQGGAKSGFIPAPGVAAGPRARLGSRPGAAGGRPESPMARVASRNADVMDSGIANHDRGGHSSPPGSVQSPPTTSTLGVASTPSRLRHQASHSRLLNATAAGQSSASASNHLSGTTSSLKKKQSMPALQDPHAGHGRTRTASLVASKTFSHPPPVPPLPFPGSSSAEHFGQQPSYVAPTASSVARVQAQKRDRERQEGSKDKDSIGRASSAGSFGSFGHSVSRPVTPIELSPSSRLTLPTTSSAMKARPAIHSIFPGHTVSPPRALPHPPAAQMLRRPKNVRLYGDGTELDEIDDLMVDRAKEGMRMPSDKGTNLPTIGLGKPSVPPPSGPRLLSTTASEKRKKPSSSSTKPKGRKAAGLIRYLGKVHQKKVGDMTWNPQTLRWEGNYGVLRDFETHTASSARPALITQYNAGTTLTTPNSPMTSQPGAQAAPAVASSVRVVGDMRFDPIKMCWLSNLAPEEDEPDPFDEMDAEFEARDEFGDDEDEDGKGGTITKGMAKTLFANGGPGGVRGASVMEGMKRWVSGSSVSATSTTTSSSSRFNTPAPSHRDASWAFSIADPPVTPPHLHAGLSSHPPTNPVSPELVAESKQAQERHKEQMKAFYGPAEYSAMKKKQAGASAAGGLGKDEKKDRERRERREEKRLWEIRNLTKK